MSLPLKCHTVSLLGIKVFALRMNEVLNIAYEHITNREKLLIGIVNVTKIVNIQKDSALYASLNKANLVLADGMPLVWLSRMLGDPLPERVAGIDIMFELLKGANKNRYRVYFLGATPEVLQKVIKTVQREYQNVCIAGYRDGYFNKDKEQSVAKDIRDSHADILFVGISSPRKENFLRRWHKYIDVPVCHGVGGSFDILAGTVKRAPTWMQDIGLEWLYRIIQEPRRMWKRYLVTNSIFLFLSFKLIFGTKLKQMISKFRHRVDRIC